MDGALDLGHAAGYAARPSRVGYAGEVLSRMACSYAWFKACAMSAIRSDGCSMPIDSRIVESRTPIFWRMSAGTPEWVMLDAVTVHLIGLAGYAA
jgi:hypothetical protein